jgi:adenosylhomocysteine nucleosidase
MAETISPTAVLFALGREARPFLRNFPVREDLNATPCKISFCEAATRLLVMETGVGQERMQRALDWLLGQPLVGSVPYLPKLVVSAGFSGALHEDLHVGDIIVATEVIGPDSECHRASWPGEPAAQTSPFRRGRLLTVDRLVADPAEKRALALRHDALAVDMETATVASRCSRIGVPFACVRAISDDAHAPLSPDLDHIIVNGRLSLARLTARLLRRPALTAELWRLARDTRLAAERLGEALRELLTV